MSEACVASSGEVETVSDCASGCVGSASVVSSANTSEIIDNESTMASRMLIHFFDIRLSSLIKCDDSSGSPYHRFDKKSSEKIESNKSFTPCSNKWDKTEKVFPAFGNHEKNRYFAIPVLRIII